MHLDIHGDEKASYNYAIGCESIPSYNDRHQQLEKQFKVALLSVSPDSQDELSWSEDVPGKADLTFTSFYTGETFKCLTYTFEMPFKDNADLPDAEFGWSPTRSARFGEMMLTAILGVVDDLRT